MGFLFCQSLNELSLVFGTCRDLGKLLPSLDERIHGDNTFEDTGHILKTVDAGMVVRDQIPALQALSAMVKPLFPFLNNSSTVYDLLHRKAFVNVSSDS